MKKIGNLLIVTLALALIAVALIGCGSKESPSSQAPTATSAVKTSPSATADTGPAQGIPPTVQAQDAAVPSSSPTEVPPSEEAPAVTVSTPDSTAPSSTQPERPVDEAPVAPKTSPADTDPLDVFSKSIQALQSLSSYSYATVMKYEGGGESGAESATTRILGEYSAPDRYHLTIIDSSDDTRNEFIKIGDNLWVYEDGGWSQVPEMAAAAISQSVFTFALEYVWGTLAAGLKTDANFVGKETVNGIQTLHYSSTNSNWERSLKAGFGSARGDIWIAEAGYPVKFVFTAAGTDEEGNSGSIEWRTEVTNVDGPSTIEPPTKE